MAASLLEDSENLTQAGKIVCGVLCIVGIAQILLLALYVTDVIPEKYKNMENERQATTLLPSKPEELTELIIPFSEPTTPSEQAETRGRIEETLNNLDKDLLSQGFKPPIYLDELVEDAVATGLLHPFDVEQFLEEARSYRAAKTEDGWKTQPIIVF